MMNDVMRNSKRRGVAMLLVLISLGMATIIATSYLSSRDNSSIIGTNVYDAAVARWAADSGVELTVAVLETQSNWRTAHTDGVLLDNYPLAGGTLRVELLDLETLNPPDSETRAVEITSVGSSNGHQQMATAEAYILDDGTNLISVDLAEFAAFATSNVIMNDDALVAIWPESPGKHLGERIALGTTGTAMGTISLNGDAAVIDGSVYAPPGASGSLVLNANSPEVDTVVLKDEIPVLDAPPSGVVTPADDPNVYSAYAPAGLAMLMSDQRWATITPAPSTLLGTKGAIQVVSEDDLALQSGTAMVIEGNAEFVVFDDFIMDPGSYIELKQGSTLTIYVGDDIILKNAYIGDLRTAAERAAPSTDGHEGYFDPERVRIFSISNGSMFSLQQQSLVQGTIYAPSAILAIQDDSAVYGRIAVNTLNMSGNGALFYDPVLNEGNGYTNPDAEVFDTGGNILSWLLAALDLGSASLTDLANDNGVAIKYDGVTYGGVTTDITPVSPGDPTPRTVQVAYDVSSFGSYVGHWETGLGDGSGGSGGTGDDFTQTQPKKTRNIMETP